ncbi:tetratricopeptide repeat protein [Candidatus Poribacteria bacterium]|nr:tetratricopeptide repeat protein [Candidatus Poribacteria bacterium]
MRHYTKILLCFLSLVLFLSLSYAQEFPEKAATPAEVDLISEKGKDSIVRIVGGNFSIGGIGTGFFVGRDKIVTNIHVVAVPGLYSAKLMNSKTVWRIEEVTAFDLKNDLVVLKIADEGIPLPLGNSDRVQTGESVYAVGFPANYTHRYKITEGIIQSTQKNNKWFRMTVDVSSGNSGGPILNSEGEVIGVATAVYDSYSYAIPSNTVKALLTETKTESLQQWHKREVIRAVQYSNIAQEKYHDKDYNQAITYLDKAIQLNPEDTFYFMSRGGVKDVLGKHDDAIDDYNQAIKLDPENVHAYNARGNTKNYIGDYKGAKDDYSKSIKLDPNNGEAYKVRGNINLKLKNYQAAFKDFTEAIRLDPQDLDANLSIAEYYRDKGIFDKAAEHLQKTGLITEDSWIVLGPFNNIGRIGFDTVYIPEAATHFDTTVKYDTIDGKVGWQKCSDDKLDGNIRFGKDVDWRVAYAWTTVTSPDEREVQFRFDSDDQGKVWLNGEEVYAHTETHKAIIDRYIFAVTLKTGKNSILVKVCEEKDGWGFYLRITDKNGHALDDLEIYRAMQIGK